MTRDELIQRLMVGNFSLSFSKLRAFTVSPDYFIRYCLRETKRTKAMRFGSMLHCLVLEPNRFSEFYATVPDGVKLNTNEGREAFFAFLAQTAGERMSDFETELGRAATFRDYKALAEWLELSQGIEFVNNTDRDNSHRMAEAILSDPRAAEIINTATDLEQAVDFDLAGWKWRGKIDIRTGGDIADLKKVKDADPRNRSLRWNLADDGYFVQQYVYRHALGEPGENRVVCVDENCQVSVLKIGFETMLQAEAEFHKTMTAFEKCRFLGDWGRSFGFWSETGEFEI
jgi:hypothetical protein